MASHYNSKKEDLFPILIGKQLRRPHTEFIFNSVINTIKKTGFPKGLFTQEEESFSYFWESIDHQKKFINKVIDITKIITKVNFDINIENIFKSIEAEKTNIFLQNFYKAATSNINTKSIIDKYLNDKTNKKDSIKNEEYKAIKNQENVEKIGYIFWIDENVQNVEKNKYFKSFKENSRYKQLHLPFYCFDNLEEPFDLIINYINFKLVFIIISGSLYPDYYHILKIKLNLLNVYQYALYLLLIYSKKYF
jgi:hypothetical protein